MLKERRNLNHKATIDDHRLLSLSFFFVVCLFESLSFFFFERPPTFFLGVWCGFQRPGPGFFFFFQFNTKGERDKKDFLRVSGYGFCICFNKNVFLTTKIYTLGPELMNEILNVLDVEGFEGWEMGLLEGGDCKW